MRIDDVLRSHGIGVGKKLKGDAVSGDVRAGKKFSNVTSNDNTGTLVVQGTTAQTIVPGTSDVVKPAGIYDGSITIKGDPDLASANIKAGVDIFGVTGKSTVVETAGDSAVNDDILKTKTAHANGVALAGNMDDNGAVTITPGTAGKSIAKGYHNGGGIVVGDPNLVTSNIKSGVSIFGVPGDPKVINTNESTVPISQGDVRNGKKGFVNGALVTGNMTDNGAQVITPGTADVALQGYYATGAKVVGDPDLIAANIKSGVNIFNVGGSVLEATGGAADSEVLSGKTFSRAGANGRTGSMPNRGAVTIMPSTADQPIPDGYHSGGGVVKGDPDLIAANILNTANIFNVQGTAIAGKRFKHGRITMVTGPSNGAIAMSITGLGFRPSIVIIMNHKWYGVSYANCRMLRCTPDVALGQEIMLTSYTYPLGGGAPYNLAVQLLNYGLVLDADGFHIDDAVFYTSNADSSADSYFEYWAYE